MEDGVGNREALAKRGGAKAIQRRLHEGGARDVIREYVPIPFINVTGDLAGMLAAAFAGRYRDVRPGKQFLRNLKAVCHCRRKQAKRPAGMKRMGGFERHASLHPRIELVE